MGRASRPASDGETGGARTCWSCAGAFCCDVAPEGFGGWFALLRRTAYLLLFDGLLIFGEEMGRCSWRRFRPATARQSLAASVARLGRRGGVGCACPPPVGRLLRLRGEGGWPPLVVSSCP